MMNLKNVNNNTKNNIKALRWTALILFLDLSSKALVKKYLGDSVDPIRNILGKYIRLHYITNEGMAFGIQIGSKLFLTIFWGNTTGRSRS